MAARGFGGWGASRCGASFQQGEGAPALPASPCGAATASNIFLIASLTYTECDRRTDRIDVMRFNIASCGRRPCKLKDIRYELLSVILY